MRVKKLVLPVAGLGKRLFPLTLKTPKPLLPLRGKPILEYVLHEAQESGIREAILVVGPENKSRIFEYLRGAQEKFPKLRFHIRMQRRPFGNGEAILMAHDIVANEPFAVRFCDDLLFHKVHGLRKLIEIFEKYRSPVFVLEEIPRKLISRYGVVAVKNPKGGPLYEILRVVEKPTAHDFAVGHPLVNLAVLGAYVMTPSIMKHLKRFQDIRPPVRDALLWTAAFQEELRREGKIYGWKFPGTRLDCGTLEGLRKAEKFLEDDKVARDW